MKIAIEGCAHGELEVIYESLKYIEETENIKVDLLICCGDFQATRNKRDLKCMAIPTKYYNLGSFYQYYNGEKQAPVLTIFIGGNHEASNYLQELPYGGWVAPNIYYLGYCGVVNINGIRIAGISGIYKGHDYYKGRFEIIPYNNNSIRSVYHIRQVDVFRLKQLTPTIDVFLSHEWPTGVYDYGDVVSLNKSKPFLKNDIDSGKLGNRPCEELLKELKPSYWFAAHLHCKFAALIPHGDGSITKFLALDKCLPKRKFLQILDLPGGSDEKVELSYDLEWLTILFLTNHLLHVKNSHTFMPGPMSSERWNFVPTEEEKKLVLSKFDGNLKIPKNFAKTALFQNELLENASHQIPELNFNPQTTYFCKKLGVTDPLELLLPEVEKEKLILSSSGEFVPENFSDSESDDNDADSSQSSLQIITPMKSINLPEPVNNSFNFEKCDSLQQSNEELNNFTSNICLESDTSILEEKEIDKNTSEEEKKTSKVVEEETIDDSPSVKKFKRRNASIYCNTED